MTENRLAAQNDRLGSFKDNLRLFDNVPFVSLELQYASGLCPYRPVVRPLAFRHLAAFLDAGNKGRVYVRDNRELCPVRRDRVYLDLGSRHPGWSDILHGKAFVLLIVLSVEMLSHE